MSLAHNGHNHLSDSNTGERDNTWPNGGMSPLGKDVIREMNRWGIMVDISHPSKQSMMQALEISKAPIIASHSAVRALCNHSRNLDDEQLLGLKKNGGVAQLVAFSGYVKCGQDTPERAAGAHRAAAIATAWDRAAAASSSSPIRPAPRSSATCRSSIASIPRRLGPRSRTSSNHIDYAVKLIGIDHVGISSDFDGGGGVDGWNNGEETFNVTLELVRRGYTEDQISKLWSGNLLRVMAENEKVARDCADTS